MQRRLEKYPNDFAANLNLGALALARLNPAAAVPMLANAVRLDRSRPDAHDMLGAALARVGRIGEAIAELRLNLANALMHAGQFDEAVEDYRKVLAARRTTRVRAPRWRPERANWRAADKLSRRRNCIESWRSGNAGGPAAGEVTIRKQ
jgi:tetratricopeptide (TPR) repeat protein